MGVNYDNELDKTISLNLVIDIDGTLYGVRQPDSGQIITDEFLQVKSPKINGVKVDIRKSNSPISTFSFRLMEFEGNKTSTKVMLDDTQLLEKECIVYAGFNTGSFDWADYIQLARTKITSVKKVSNGYSFRTKEATNLIASPALNTSDILTTFILGTSTTLSITDSTDWPTSGTLKVDNEFLTYTGKNVDGITLENLSRGVPVGGYPSVASEHNVGTEVFLVTKLESVNPVDMILQILLSKLGDLSNDPTYDVLPNGLGIAPDNVDITAIESIRDTHFNLELHNLYVYGEDDLLQYLEKNLLPSVNLRFITVEGKISVSLLDQVDFNDTPPIINEDSIRGVPTWGLTSDKVVNVIEVQYDFNQATSKFSTIEIFKDQNSINTFGLKKTLKLKMPSIITSLNGAALVAERALRLLGRLSTARGKVTLTCHFDKSNISVGSNVQIAHRFLPQQGGTLGFNDQLEVMSRSIDLDKALVKYRLEFTSYTGIRVPFIGYSPKITELIDNISFKVSADDAACLSVGDRILLFKDGPLSFGNPTIGDYLPDPINTIDSIVGEVITFTNPWASVLELDLWLKMPDYDQATPDQKSKFSFVGFNSGFYPSDNSKSYQIIF